jgi:hypothetical protein
MYNRGTLLPSTPLLRLPVPVCYPDANRRCTIAAMSTQRGWVAHESPGDLFAGTLSGPPGRRAGHALRGRHGARAAGVPGTARRGGVPAGSFGRAAVAGATGFRSAAQPARGAEPGAGRDRRSGRGAAVSTDHAQEPAVRRRERLLAGRGGVRRGGRCEQGTRTPPTFELCRLHGQVRRGGRAVPGGFPGGVHAGQRAVRGMAGGAAGGVAPAGTGCAVPACRVSRGTRGVRAGAGVCAAAGGAGAVAGGCAPAVDARAGVERAPWRGAGAVRGLPPGLGRGAGGGAGRGDEGAVRAHPGWGRAARSACG